MADVVVRLAPLPRCVAVCLGVGAGVAGLGSLLAPDLLAATAALADGTWRLRSLEELLEWVAAAAAAAAALALCWLWLVSGVVAAEAARGVRRPGLPGCPAALRRTLLAACGAAVTGSVVAGLAVPASADPLPLPVPVGGGSLASGADTDTGDGPDLHGLPLPDRARSAPGRDGAHEAPRGGPQAGRAPRRPRTSTTGDVVVRNGDTLWALAAGQLAAEGVADPTDAVIDARWRLLYAANADVVGPDPDLVHPGQRLALPAPSDRPGR